jgi:hypothetical protein
LRHSAGDSGEKNECGEFHEKLVLPFNLFVKSWHGSERFQFFERVRPILDLFLNSGAAEADEPVLVSLLSKINCRSIAGALKKSSPVIPIIDLLGSSPSDLTGPEERN